MSASALQIATLVAAAILVVAVPLLLVLLGARVQSAAHGSTRVALADLAKQHERATSELQRQHEHATSELQRQHERAAAELQRQHERALAELGAEHLRIAQEFGMFSQKRHQVYARLYARYRKATRDCTAALAGADPEFAKFSRDDLLRYLHAHNIREKDAADAISAMDRGDTFAMNKLMARLHWRVTLRDASAAFEQAREFEALNELYLSDDVRDAVGNLRRKLEALSSALMREQERSDPERRAAKQDELQSAVASLLVAMREDLRPGEEQGAGARAHRMTEIDRTGERNALSAQNGLADKAPPPITARSS